MALRAVAYANVHFQATAPTRFSRGVPPGRLNKLANGQTILAACAGALPAEAERPRLRVIGLRLPNEELPRVWDLDLLSVSERSALLETVLKIPAWIGSNLAEAVAWLLAEGVAVDQRPRLLDAVMFAQALRADFLHRARTIAALSDRQQPVGWHESISDAAIGRALDAYSANGFSLDALAVAAGIELPPSKSADAMAWERYPNWMVPDLCEESRRYIDEMLSVPESLIRAVLVAIGQSMRDLIGVIDFTREHAGYQRAESAVWALGQMHGMGVGVDLEACQAFIDREADRKGRAVDVIAPVPEFAAHRDELLAERDAESPKLKAAFAAYVERTVGIEIPEREALGEPFFRLRGLHKEPVIAALLALRDAKRRLRVLGELVAHTEKAGEGRAHPLIKQSAITGRVAAIEPAILSMSGDHRAAISARPGCKLVATDYSAIEMRIAARLALRAISEYREDAFAGAKGKLFAAQGDWEAAKERIENMARAIGAMSSRPSADDLGRVRIFSREERDRAQAESDLAWWLSRIRQAEVAGVERGCRMAEAFKKGIDPHLLTTIVATGRAPEDAYRYLAVMPAEERARLKESLAVPRRSAKALNFGLLFGMIAETLWQYGIVEYGLDWTLSDAESAHSAWFALYPEIGFWHAWTRLCYRRFPTEPWRDGYGRVSRRSYPLAETLSGRLLYADAAYKLLNYQAQGTGVDIAFEVLRLWDEMQSPWPLVLFNQDEFVLEVPEPDAEEAKLLLEHATVKVANRVLFPIPAEVETTISSVWTR